MTEPRIQGAPERGPLRKVAYGMARRRLGEMPEPFAIAAHHTTVFSAMSGFELALERCKSVPIRYKALGELRAAMVVGCEWCADIGSMIARKSGLTDDELKELVDWQNGTLLDERDKLVLEYADAITRTPVDVGDDLFDRLRAHFDEKQLVELTAAIAWENWRARFNWAFGIDQQGYSEGAYCVPVVSG
ncbi:MAG TPA: carboxymuconolactone decarboxylase family protein [Thermoleophilaceae bacterium]|nr:carboxymuconolactone decarboxylase family protein [Thermoleophilaceae bacterium]